MLPDDKVRLQEAVEQADLESWLDVIGEKRTTAITTAITTAAAATGTDTITSTSTVNKKKPSVPPTVHIKKTSAKKTLPKLHMEREMFDYY